MSIEEDELYLADLKKQATEYAEAECSVSLYAKALLKGITDKEITPEHALYAAMEAYILKNELILDTITEIFQYQSSKTLALMEEDSKQNLGGTNEKILKMLRERVRKKVS